MGLRAMAFDVDPVSAASLREALPGWQIDTVDGATVGSLPCNWNPGLVDLLVVGVREDVTETWGLCRFLVQSASSSRDSRQEVKASSGLANGFLAGARQSDVPLLVLVPAAQKVLLEVGLEAGALSCLMLPIHAKEVASMVVRARAGNQPGRHTNCLDRAQTEDDWRDEGGQG